MVNRRRNYAYYKNYKKLYPVVTYVSPKIRKVGGGEKGKQVGDEKKQTMGKITRGKARISKKELQQKQRITALKIKTTVSIGFFEISIFKNSFPRTFIF